MPCVMLSHQLTPHDGTADLATWERLSIATPATSSETGIATSLLPLDGGPGGRRGRALFRLAPAQGRAGAGRRGGARFRTPKRVIRGSVSASAER